ncbi:MAG: cell division protein SepF [Clostridia bacterium]|nr:cell division protein SepF [Clostridia bacterium]
MPKDDWKETVRTTGKTSKATHSHESAPTSKEKEGSKSSNVVYLTPSSFADVQQIIDYLKEDAPVFFNLSGINKEVGQRILDYVAGAAYALGGSMKRIQEYMFLVTPSGVGISVPLK